MFDLLLARTILAIHFAFVLGVVLPVPLILIGAWRGWKWVRNKKFRIIHLCMMGIVLAETVVGMLCPLTVWEQALRLRAGETSYEGSFIGHWISRLMYYDFEPWVFTLTYFAFFALIVALYFLVPPKRN